VTVEDVLANTEAGFEVPASVPTMSI